MPMYNYKPGDENREDYTDAKRTLFVQTMEQSAMECCGTLETEELMERTGAMDIDDNELDLDVYVKRNVRQARTELRLRFEITEKRRRRHPEVPPPVLFLQQPIITELFHTELKVREKLIIADVVLGRALQHTDNEVSGLTIMHDLFDLIIDRYRSLINECTTDDARGRTEFSFL